MPLVGDSVFVSISFKFGAWAGYDIVSEGPKILFYFDLILMTVHLLLHVLECAQEGVVLQLTFFQVESGV